MQGLDLSPIGLFIGASLVGKAVMGVLFWPRSGAGS